MSAPALGSRRAFPNLRPRVYANHAGISPASSAVEAAIAEVGRDYGEGGFAAFPKWAERRGRLRADLARLVGGAPHEIAFVPSTTAGISALATCLPWRRGDRVLVFSGEFPANVVPWQRAAALFGLDLRLLPGLAPEDDADEWLAGLAPHLAGARLVAVSAVQFQTGLRMPLAALARAAHAGGAELAVDAVQAAGIAPLDVRRDGVDYLASGSHKWLMGLEGSGFLYARAELQPRLVPNLAGWMSTVDPFGFLTRGPGQLRYDRPIRASIDFVEGGNLSVLSFAALGASLGLLDALGVPAIFDHVQAWHDALEPALLARGFVSRRSKDPARRSGILSALPPAGVDVVELRRRLEADGVAVAIPDGHLRFSPHFANAVSEVTEVVLALDRALST